jgi:hypothetical protein
MTRRELIARLGTTAATWPLRVRAQQDLLDHRIGKRKQLIRNIEADCFRGLVSNSSRLVSERLVKLGSKAAKMLPLIYAPLRGPPYPSHRCKQQATGNPEDHERSQYKEPQSNCIGVPCNQRLHKATWRHKLC